MDDGARDIKAILARGDEDGAILRKPVQPMARLKDESVVLVEIEQALERLDGGCFGYCTSCGAPIDILRLSHDPTIKLCLSCAGTSKRTS